MAIGDRTISCTVVLHDNAVSPNDVLCGANVLPTGSVGYLSAAGAETLCIFAAAPAANANEISIHSSVARHFKFENRMKASIQVVEDVDTATATHVELLFRDQHLSRADMWRIKGQIDSSVLYQGQKLKYLGSVTANVEAIYMSGREVQSAVVMNPQTKLIFRSSSAQFTILIQISKEMLEHWNQDGSLMYESLINGFLPDLFSRWVQLKVRHQVSVVIFGRRAALDDMQKVGDGTSEPSRLRQSQCRDFYHVLAFKTPSSDHHEILRRLKKIFNSLAIHRQPSLAANGNMLEAIHLGAMDFADETIDARLGSTGTSIIAITAGAGLFETQYDSLKRTTDMLMGRSIGVDIVCLSPKPFHPVPLFHYKVEGRSEYALPHWVDISYWRPNHVATSTNWLWTNTSADISSIAIPQLVNGAVEADFAENDAQDLFDEDAFSNATSHTTSHGSTATDRQVVVPVAESRDHSKNPGDNVAVSRPTIRHLPLTANGEEQRAVFVSSESTYSLRKPKGEALQAHPLLKTSRNISLGSKGIALRPGVASPTVSVQHVQQEKDASGVSSFAANEATSGLAKQIRASLRGKPYQYTSASASPSIVSPPSEPISIHATEPETSDELPDPASVIEKAVMDQTMQGGQAWSNSLSATPKAQASSLPVPGLHSSEESNGMIAPWLTLLNPCNPRRDNMRVANEYRQWQHVFPKTVSSSAFKWESICIPASLPLMTELRVSLTDLERHFDKKVRRMVVTSTDSMGSTAAHQVMLQMIAMRLTAGFQVVPLRKVPRAQMPSEQIDRIMLSLGGLYHDLRCLSNAEVQVIEYQRRSQATDNSPDDTPAPDDKYFAKMRPVNAHKQRHVEVNMKQSPTVADWSPLDDQSVNPAALSEEPGICLMRLVLIPVDPPGAEQQGAPGIRGLADDEKRIDGIQRLTQMWQRNRYFSDADMQHHAFLVKVNATGTIDRDPRPLAIEYNTRDPTTFVSAYEATYSNQLVNKEELPKISSEFESFQSNDFDMVRLVKLMQDPPPEGVDLRDRRWFTRLHLKCFRGDEMTNWLLRVFKDLNTREDAVALGNRLMELDIFTHVRGKHEFRDGHYLYQIMSAHRTTDYPDSAGFFGKAVGWSVPSTPISEQRQSPMVAPHGTIDSPGKGMPTPTVTPSDRRETKEVMLSQKVQYNVDSTRKSDQLEIINLHYTCIHNPENCFHIRIDWTSATSKLIRESVTRWGALVESYGHRLVQLPLDEACRVHERHPFERTVSIKLSIRPPDKIPETPQLNAQSLSPRTTEDPIGFHKAILRKFDFVLDFESASSFPRGIDVRYSWGRPDYRLTQFIHKSGLVLAQISNDGKSDFLLLPNRLAPPGTSMNSKKADSVTVEKIVQEFESFCRDEDALRAVLEDLNRPKMGAPSPSANATLDAEVDIPPIELSPHRAHRVALRNIS